ncbi:MAG: hypothetical protein EXR62_01540 [Chloroflexi bacterium]|nr:hypothetical protein [Chloroflexota bacterium]
MTGAVAAVEMDAPARSAADLVASLAARQVSVQAVDGHLVLESPPGALTPELRQEVSAHKADLLALLQADGHRVGADGRPPLPQRGRWILDPRPDLPDTDLWRRLLPLAFDLDGHDPAGLFGSLHGLRCGGARLRRDGSPPGGQVYLVGGDWGEAYAELYIRYIVRHTEVLRELLGML